MVSPLTVLGVGLSSVFTGMAFLYISIRLTAAIVSKLEKPESKETKK